MTRFSNLNSQLSSRFSAPSVAALAAALVASSGRAQCAPAPTDLRQGTATWSQPCNGSYRPSNLIDGNAATAWALGRCNGAADETLTESLVFETATDIVGVGATVQLAIFSGRYEPCCGGGMMTVGRFRVWVTATERSEFADGRTSGGQIGSSWTLLTPDQIIVEPTDAFGVSLASSQAVPAVTLLPSGAVQLSGANPEYTRVTVIARSPLSVITGVRLELVNEASSGVGGYKGPGRHANGNCEIREISLSTTSGPRIDTAPQDQYVCPGGATSFYVGVSGPGPFRYQWRRNGRDLRGATGNVYVVPAATAATAGEYDCVVTGPCGVTISDPAQLVICPADVNCDQFLDFFDYDAFVACYDAGECEGGSNADFNGDGFVDFFDYDAFVESFEAGC